MRKNKQETAETKQRIIEAASFEFRQKGIDGTGLADLMAAAGMKHGGFYKHFTSKEHVVEESLAYAIEDMRDSMTQTISASPGTTGLNAAIADYLSPSHRDYNMNDCPFASVGGEMARCSEPVRERMEAGLVGIIDMFAAQVKDSNRTKAKNKSVVMMATMIGALVMSRIVVDDSFSELILQESYKALVQDS